MSDSELGISLRLIRDWKPDYPPQYAHMTDFDDKAIALAISDERDIDFNEKISDALAFLRERTRQIH